MKILTLAALPLLALGGPAMGQDMHQMRSLVTQAGTIARLYFAMEAANQCNIRGPEWYGQAMSGMTRLQEETARRHTTAMIGGLPSASAYLMGASGAGMILAGQSVGWAEHETCDQVGSSAQLRQLDGLAGRRR